MTCNSRISSCDLYFVVKLSYISIKKFMVNDLNNPTLFTFNYKFRLGHDFVIRSKYHYKSCVSEHFSIVVKRMLHQK